MKNPKTAFRPASVQRNPTPLVSPLLWFFALLALVRPATGNIVDFSNGFQVSQENFTFAGASQAYSSYGLAAVNITQMAASTGISDGFLNVFDSSQNSWVVRNLPISSSSGLPGISTMFNLGNAPGNQVASIALQADLSPTPLQTFSGTSVSASYATTQLNYNAQGAGPALAAPPGAPPNPGLVSFVSGGVNSSTWQPGHTSVEQDVNQCGPASVANSLD